MNKLLCGMAVLSAFFLCSCQAYLRPVPRPPSLVRLSTWHVPLFEDDFDTSSLRTAAWQSLSYFQGLPPNQTFTMASDVYTARDLVESMQVLIQQIDQSRTKKELSEAIRQQFWIYQSVGTDSNRTVTFSAYYEPTIPARLKRDDQYRFPIYSRPEDLLDVDLSQFEPAYEGAHIAGRIDGRHLVPYYTRGEIDSQTQLGPRNLELAWARDPVDVFFLQIEGSGWLDIGEPAPLRIRYDGANGRLYHSVGQYLLSKVRFKGNTLSHDQFKQYLNDHPRGRQSILNVDERYIFFRVDNSTASAYAFGNIDVPLTPGRSIATDPKLFPKGLLAWMETEKSPLGKPLRRFVLNQDEGGAIQGPGRVDFFVGHGPSAEQFATHFWEKGKLYFLVRKR